MPIFFIKSAWGQVLTRVSVVHINVHRSYTSSSIGQISIRLFAPRRERSPLQGLLETRGRESRSDNFHERFAATEHAHQKATQAIEGKVDKEGRIVGEDTFKKGKPRRDSQASNNSQLGKEGKHDNVVKAGPELFDKTLVFLLLVLKMLIKLLRRAIVVGAVVIMVAAVSTPHASGRGSRRAI